MKAQQSGDGPPQGRPRRRAGGRQQTQGRRISCSIPAAQAACQSGCCVHHVDVGAWSSRVWGDPRRWRRCAQGERVRARLLRGTPNGQGGLEFDPVGGFGRQGATKGDGEPVGVRRVRVAGDEFGALGAGRWSRRRWRRVRRGASRRRLRWPGRCIRRQSTEISESRMRARTPGRCGRRATGGGRCRRGRLPRTGSQQHVYCSALGSTAERGLPGIVAARVAPYDDMVKVGTYESRRRPPPRWMRSPQGRGLVPAECLASEASSTRLVVRLTVMSAWPIATRRALAGGDVLGRGANGEDGGAFDATAWRRVVRRLARKWDAVTRRAE